MSETGIKFQITSNMNDGVLPDTLISYVMNCFIEELF